MPDNQFGPYELRRLLGRGGMGEVHLAYDRSHQREVAVKLLLESLSSDHEYRARFEREARIAAGLREQHIIPIHRFGEIDNRLYIDMRLVEGEDLGKLLARKRMLPPARAVRIIAQVAAALDAAHRAGLVHRDVKPANVLLAETGSSTRDSVYLADFGIARDSAGGTSGGFTLTGVAIGTPDYMAPERFTAGTCDHRADVYALGCMLYELLTGQKPFSAAGALALAYRHVNDPPPLPSSLRPEVSAALDAVVATSMSKDPAARYGSAGELASAAEAATAGDARNGAAPRGQDQATRKPPGPWDPVEPGRRWSRWFYDPSPIVGAAATRPWPAATDYVRAVQASAEPLARSGLPGASVVRDRFGMPATSTGQNAVVFEFNNGHGGLALRCFTRSPRDAAARYRALAPVLAASDCDVVAPARWVDVALTIGDESWPAVVMPWVSGLPLNLAVEDLLDSPRDLVRLAEVWRDGVSGLWASGLAHGDLQCGNILVERSGELHLVDLDGVYVPTLSRPPAEYGHPDFQHPRRSVGDWGPDMDAFSGLVVDLSLRALAADPGLWRFNSGENLVLAREDYERPGQTPVWEELGASPDAEVVRLADTLATYCTAGSPPANDEVLALWRRPGTASPAPVTARPPRTAVEEVAPPALVSEKWWADETVIAAAAEPRPGHGPQVTPSAGSWLGRNAIVTGLSAGLLCALLIIAVYAVFGSTIPVVGQAPLLVGLAGAVLTAGLAAIPRASMGARASAAGLGLGGALLGILMSLAALGGFSAMANGLIDPGRASALVVLAWTLCAVSIGIASGIMRSGRAAVSGLIGGSIGGCVGGMIHWASGPTFVDLGSYSALAIDIANPSTLIALILACTAIGLSIGVVDRVRRQAWLTVIEGRLRGREIILDRRRVTIGSAAHAALRLADEPGVAPEHAVLLRGDQDGYALQCHGRVELNGRSCSTAQPVPLNSGDVLRVGGSFVRFQQREQT